jgi:hypothetical protein
MGATDRVTTINILINVTMSFLIGMFIFFIYKRTYQGVLYQRSFNISLVLASVVTSLVIMTISGNLILSLGMVGALSIVRFRTPVKDSMDLIFLFWAISTGIANGVGYFNISLVGSILISLFLIILTGTKSKSSDAFLVVVQINSAISDSEILNKIRSGVDKYSLKSKVLSKEFTEVTLEVRISNNATEFLNHIKAMDGVNRLTLVAYDQDLSAV